MSLRLRLLVTLAPLFVVALVAADVGTFVALQSSLLSRVDDQLISAHHSVESSLVGRDTGGEHGVAPTLPPGTYGELRSTNGDVIVSQSFGYGTTSGSIHPLLPANLRVGTVPIPEFLTVKGTGGIERYRAYVDNAIVGNGNILIVAIPLDDVDATLAHLLYFEVAIAGGVTLVVVAATWLVVRRGLRPLERMGATARSIVASDLSRRVAPANEKTEVGRLGSALNTMLTQLEAAFAERARSEQRLRQFVSDASHELRTPLTSMRGYAELLHRKPEMERHDVLLAMRRIVGETERMGVLVDDLLLLARLDQGRPLQHHPVDLAQLVADASADAHAADSGRSITAQAAPPMIISGDEMRLRQALGNILRNASVHTPSGTAIEVELRRDGVYAVLDVVDHGPGIPPEHAERIFERFHRVDPDQSRDQGGSGLGLSIAAAIIVAHGGRISVQSTPGGGATFRIELPLGEPGPESKSPDSQPIPSEPPG